MHHATLLYKLPLALGTLCAALLVSVAACETHAEATNDSRVGFEPITCSAEPTPCA